MEWVSGIISSLITKSMAPPARARMKPRVAEKMETSPTHKKAPMGSTSPVKVAIAKAFLRV